MPCWLRLAGVRYERPKYHFEADIHGVVFFEQRAEITGQVEDLTDHAKIPFVNLGHLVYPVASVLNTALRLIGGSITNVLIRYELLDWVGVGFLAEGQRDLPNIGGVARDQRCLNARLAVSTTAVLETLKERRAQVLTEVMRQLLWAFNYTNPNLLALVDSTLRDNRLI